MKQSVSPVSADETAVKQNPEVEFEQRAAIAEFDDSLSRPHAETLAALQVIQPPPGVTQGQLADIIDLAAHRLDRLRSGSGMVA